MKCDAAQAFLIDHLSGNLSDTRELDGHLAGCPGCRKEAAELRALWSNLGELDVPATALPSARRILASYRAGRASARTVALRIAAGVALIVLGFAAGRWPTTPSSPPEFEHAYALLLSTSSSTTPLPGARLSEIVREYRAWAGELRAAGQLIVAEKFSSEVGTRLFAEEGQIVTANEPIDENGERMGGLFLIRARDREDALNVASECPHLKYGGVVLVREIEPTG